MFFLLLSTNETAIIVHLTFLMCLNVFGQKNNYEVLDNDKRTGLPSMVKLNQEVNIQDFQQWFKLNFQVEDEFIFVLKDKQKDELGFEHFRFNLYHGSNKVFGEDIIAHVKKNNVLSFNGYFISSLTKPNQSISEEKALTLALNNMNAKQYKWELPLEEKELKRATKGPFASYYPASEVVYAPTDGDFKPENYKMCYRFEIYAHEKLIHHSDRGFEYCNPKYTEFAEENGIMMSMTKQYDPYENAAAERVNRTLKYEYGLKKVIKNTDIAQKVTKQAVFIYNNLRTHFSLDL